jgi:hypothetical protein
MFDRGRRTRFFRAFTLTSAKKNKSMGARRKTSANKAIVPSAQEKEREFALVTPCRTALETWCPGGDMEIAAEGRNQAKRSRKTKAEKYHIRKGEK